MLISLHSHTLALLRFAKWEPLTVGGISFDGEKNGRPDRMRSPGIYLSVEMRCPGTDLSVEKSRLLSGCLDVSLSCNDLLY